MSDEDRDVRTAEKTVSVENLTRTVTLVLQGGHLVKLSGSIDVDSLAEILERNPTEEVFEIISDQSERVLLRRSALLGVMERYEDTGGPTNLAQGKIPFLRVQNFLPEKEQRDILDHILTRRFDFEPSGVTAGPSDARKSTVIRHDDILESIFRSKVYSVLPKIAQQLDLDVFQRADDLKFECQVTAHNDGGYYRSHNDSGDKTTSHRLFSFVYYFQYRDSGFFGGDLKIFTNDPIKSELSGLDYLLIKPDNNSIVFFPSHLMHEVTLTHVPSKEFEDSRFTVNGWVGRQKP